MAESLEEWRWEELVAHATLGTGRRPDVAVQTVGGQPVDAATPEARLLSAAAAMAAGIRSSMVATHVGPPDARWAAPEEEPLPVAPVHAVQLLDAVLAGILRGPLVRSLVTLWLQQAGVAGWRVPGDRIGAVLDASPVPLPSDAVAALGRRGRWLAGFGTAAWSHRLIDVEAAAEVLGSHAGRVAVRTAVIRLWCDAPDRGRQVLQARWDGWDAVTRAAVVDAVGGLAGLEDELWLEAALSDVEPVAVAAARVLRQLPDSALVRRMAGRLGQVVAAETGTEGIVLAALSTRPSPEDLRDAVTPVAERTVGWWAREVRRSAPLHAWASLIGGATEISGETPRAIVVAVQVADPVVLLDVATAAAALGDVGWATDLLAGLLAGHMVPGVPGARGVGAGALVDVDAQVRWTEALRGVLDLLPTPWPAELTAQVIGWVLGHPRPADALGGLAATLVQGPGIELDERLADARPSGLFAAQIDEHIRTIQTARSLRRAIIRMRTTLEPDTSMEPT